MQRSRFHSRTRGKSVEKNNKHMNNLEKITGQHGNSPYYIIWLVVSLDWNIFMFRYIEKNNSNWLSYFSEG